MMQVKNADWELQYIRIGFFCYLVDSKINSILRSLFNT